MLLTFHGKQEIKDKYVKRMRDHIAADELIRGIGYEDGRGCAVGCTLDGYSHEKYPIELGIPIWVGKIEDIVFEGMSQKKSQLFPLYFLELMPVGINLEQIKAPFLIFILESTLDKFDHEKFPNVFSAINAVINLYKTNCKDLQKFKDAADAAYAAFAADTTTATAAYAITATAAYAAVHAAAFAADTTTAAYAITAAYAAATAATGYVKAKTYDAFADKLLDLIKNSK